MKNKRLQAKIAAKKAAMRKAQYEYCFALLDGAKEILDNVNSALDEVEPKHEEAMKARDDAQG